MMADLNRRPFRCKRNALPTELIIHKATSGFEPKLQGHEACDLTISLHRVYILVRQNRELNSVLQSMNLVLYHLSYFAFFCYGEYMILTFCRCCMIILILYSILMRRNAIILSAGLGLISDKL